MVYLREKPPCRHNIYHYITFEEQSLQQSVFAITNMYFLCRFLCYQCMTLFLKALIEPQEKCYNLNEKISTLLARSKWWFFRQAGVTYSQCLCFMEYKIFGFKIASSITYSCLSVVIGWMTNVNVKYLSKLFTPN